MFLPAHRMEPNAQMRKCANFSVDKFPVCCAFQNRYESGGKPPIHKNDTTTLPSLLLARVRRIHKIK
jgi:hypothetical protein